MSFPRYPIYKDSGVEWLGEVPGHWEVKPLKQIFDIVGGSTPKSDTESFWDGDILWATPSDLSKRDTIYMDDTLRKITSTGLSSCGTTLVPIDSIILSTRAPIGSLAIAAKEMCTNQGCKALVPSKKAKTEYFAHLLSISSTELNIRGKGTTFLELSGDELGAFRLPTPSLAEQTQIAAFLDRETEKIDGLVAEQQRLMALLKEKRQAVISHAVTQGLNPLAPMKSSGVEWLGNIPEGWNILNLGLLIETSELGGNYESSESENGIPQIKMGNLDRGFIKTHKIEYLPEDTEYNKSYILKYGDFLFNTRNSLYLVGKVAVWKAELPNAIYNSNILRISFKKQKIDSTEFMSYFFNSDLGLSQLRMMAKGTTSVAAIYYKDLITLRIVLPPISVQHLIVEYLNEACAKLDTLITETQHAITLLQERRTALISAAVTGQIDVRAAGEL